MFGYCAANDSSTRQGRWRRSSKGSTAVRPVHHGAIGEDAEHQVFVVYDVR
jgi:hypothetical protein